MRKAHLTFGAILMACAGLFSAAMPAAAQMSFTTNDIASAPQCGRYPSGQDVYLCQCPSDFSRAPVWGSGPYTADSNICTAALHAGAISAKGGAVFVTATQGLNSYSGTDQNGVSTSNWGSYGTSLFIEAARASSSLENCSSFPSDADSYTCACAPATGNTGSVWGNGPYTADSNICDAARHAGYLDDGAGTVTALRMMGLDSYAGTEWNGITTRGYGSYSSSFVFNGN